MSVHRARNPMTRPKTTPAFQKFIGVSWLLLAVFVFYSYLLIATVHMATN